MQAAFADSARARVGYGAPGPAFAGRDYDVPATAAKARSPPAAPSWAGYGPAGGGKKLGSGLGSVHDMSGTLASRLLRWYRRHRRRLPWREEPSPYRVWVSELMLQQTRVSTVLPYYERFLRRFPSVERLAAATEQEVLAAWSGLGYYRRAKSLHRAARVIVEERGGRFPAELDGWLALPGVGRYTAGAILSIAFGERVPIVDGNVARVLCRLFGLRGDPRKGSTRDELWRKAEEILPRRFVSEFNQALMELGALVCTPSSPRCLVCPWRDDCAARAAGLTGELPELEAPRKTLAVTMAAAVVAREDRILLYRRTAPGLMNDMWELPGGECRADERPREALVREARERYGIELTPARELARVRHAVMHKRITLHAYSADAELRRRRRGGSESAWVRRDEISRVPVSSIVHKVLRAIRD